VNKLLPNRLSRRERQIMEILYRSGEATVAQVLAAMPDPPSYSAVRAFLRILEEKGQITHSNVDGRYVYRPIESWPQVSKSAIEQVVDTFFGGSLEAAVATLLSNRTTRPNEEELNRLEALIQQARASSSEGDAQ
jgi:BlaI family penicillinase repressor